MATVPLSGTNIALYSGIPWTNDYKHTRWFDTLSDQLNWFASQTHVATFTNANFQRIDGGRPFMRVQKSVDELWSTNYISFQNADYNKVFYGFVTDLKYVQKNTTDIFFEIDVLQTWKFEMNFQPSFVVREHCPLWNTDGSPIINTVPEDLNYGTEYDTVQVTNINPLNGYKFLVVVSKSTIHTQDGTTGLGVSFPAKSMIPTVLGTPQPLSVYIVPFKDNDTAAGVSLPQGGTPQVSKPSEFLRGLYLTDSAINNVVSLYVTDWCGVDVSESGGMLTFANNNNEIIPVSFSATDPTTSASKTYYCLYLQSVWSFAAKDFYLGGLYSGFKNVTESKLLMHPYTSITLDDFKGNRVDYKPQYINNTNLYATVKGSLGPSNKVSYGIQDYNSATATNKLQVSDEHALINNDPTDVPIINDNLGAFLQGHKNTLNNQKASINWNAGMNIANGAINGVMGGMMMGPLGAAQSVGQTIQGAGNSVLQLQGILAKEQDIANVPPQLAKMGSNTSYNVGNGYNGVFVIKKHIKDEYITKLQNYFNMYGYKKNETKIPNFHTRQNWNYVQTVGCVIRASVNNDDLQELKSVFDGGITLWHTDDIGNYTLSNGVL